MAERRRRSAGVLVPLFSIRSGDEWGIGEYPDLGLFAGWAAESGLSMLMTLPLLEPSPGQDSPYSSCSFFALDPLYIRLEDVPEFGALGGEPALPPRERALLARVRGSRRVLQPEIRALKEAVLGRCFAHFRAAAEPARRADFDAFQRDHAHWLPDYALFRTLKTLHPQSWRDWPTALRDGEAMALETVRSAHADAIAWRTWLQWVAFRQLEAARATARTHGVLLAGDEPFLVADDSADVWANKALFRFDATVGAPPDAFSADGQEWGLPPYDWSAIAASDFALFRARGRHSAALFDAVRIDHVVGLYRTYHRPLDKSKPHFFLPVGPVAQQAQGEAVLAAFAGAGVALVAEDLGVIPDFVRASLRAQGIPGYRVLRWEKDGARFRDPATWPEASVATTGTHDTESSWQWWEQLSAPERTAVLAIPGLASLDEPTSVHFDDRVGQALLETVYATPSQLALIPIQDLLGLRERINTPGTVGPQNWSFRLPWTIAAMREDAIVRARSRFLRELAERTERAPTSA